MTTITQSKVDILTQKATDLDVATQLCTKYIPTQDEWIGIKRGLADMKAGRSASQEQVNAVYKKHGLI